jgi:two-component system chemotaxis response regulator CheB
VRREEARVARVVLVDDSEASRAELRRILEAAGGVRVVGAARDGEEALREVLRLEPDAVFLDLQMPRMDGFTFLRVLMARRPTPVVVVSSQSRRSDAFKALELGALDFVAKPEPGVPYAEIAAALVEKCELLRALRPRPLPPAPAGPPPGGGADDAWRDARGGAVSPAALAEPARVVAVGASTGGPQALQRLLTAVPADLPVGFVVAQHMPEKFTAAFAERLSRTTRFAVQEAAGGDAVATGRVLVAPGGRHLEVRRDGEGILRAEVLAPGGGAPRQCPSVDRLLASVARALGPRACGVVLTGMGRDGRAGIVEIKRAGGLALAESAESAVVYGMPQAAAESGALDALLPLDGLAERIARFGRGA